MQHQWAITDPPLDFKAVDWEVHPASAAKDL